MIVSSKFKSAVATAYQAANSSRARAAGKRQGADQGRRRLRIVLGCPQLFIIQPPQRLSLERRWRATFAKPEHMIDPFVNVGLRAFVQHPGGQRLSCLDIDRVIEQRKCLQRRVGSRPLGRAGQPRRGVEIHKAGIRRAAFEHDVDAAPISVLARADLIVSLRAADLYPQPVWLIGANRRPKLLFAEQAGDGQRVVANHLGIHADSRSPRVELILVVALEQLGRHLRRLPVRGRGDDLSQHLLHRPTVVHELHRQPIEQLRMSRRLALHAKILNRFHDAVTENLGPPAIHRDTRHERIASVDEPLCQRQPVAFAR